ncbi:MAG: hypothetical protein JWM90_2367 [Thermoleophilia bacterium]|nr:hypothetical protein [Thermoleophilia bacterium]
MIVTGASILAAVILALVGLGVEGKRQRDSQKLEAQRSRDAIQVEARRSREARYVDTVQPILDETIACGAMLVQKLLDALVVVSGSIEADAIVDYDLIEKVSVASISARDENRRLLVLQQRWTVLGIHGSEARQVAGEVLAAMHELWDKARIQLNEIQMLFAIYGQRQLISTEWPGERERLRVAGHGTWTEFDRMRNHIHAFVMSLDDRQPPEGQPPTLSSLLAEVEGID